VIKVTVSWTDVADRTLGLPVCATGGAAGFDIRANLDPGDRDAGLAIPAWQFRLVPSGLKLALPDGCEAQIRPRSGLALNKGVTVLNAPGTIDSDYRGEIGVILQNCSCNEFVVGHGDRIAQMVFARLQPVQLLEDAELDLTSRAEGGFGSTGR